jgi:hypothetical protein
VDNRKNLIGGLPKASTGEGSTETWNELNKVTNRKVASLTIDLEYAIKDKEEHE